MDDLTNRLRQLGEATEAATAPVAAAEVLPPDQALDLDVAMEDARGGAIGPERKPSGIMLVAAAALVLLAAGSALFVRRSDNTPASLETASAQTESGGEFAIPVDDNGWERLRFCESTGDYQVDTGSTFYGAYQFTQSYFSETAERLGLDQYVHMNPATAPPEVQDAIANALYLEYGNDPWPVCKRYFNGAQVTPVVPQWIGQTGLEGVEVIVFLDPTVTDAQSERAESEINGIVEVDRYTFVNKEDAYEEFQAMFADDKQIRESVAVQDMPPSFRIIGELTAAQVARLRGLPGVFEVVEADESIRFDPPPPMKISIPAIELNAPIYPTATTENLAKGAVVLGGDAIMPSIAGYGSVEGSVFERLDELRDGDLIEVSMLIRPDDRFAMGLSSQVTRTYRVIGVGDGAPETVAVDQLPAWSAVERGGATLVADVTGDAVQRLVITTEIAEPEILGYGIEGDS